MSHCVSIPASSFRKLLLLQSASLALLTPLLLLASAQLRAAPGSSTPDASAGDSSQGPSAQPDDNMGPPPDMDGQGGPGSGPGADSALGAPGAPGKASRDRPPMPPPGSGSHKKAVLRGMYLVDGQQRKLSGLVVAATEIDTSGLFVLNHGNLDLADASVKTSGNTSSEENSSFFGQNAAALVTSGGSLSLENSAIATTGSGANGVIATGRGSIARLSHVRITARASGGHGVMATLGGALELTDVDISTTGAHGAPLATDRGGGTLVVRGGTYRATGEGSPGIYSTGSILVSGGGFEIPGSEGCVIEGTNSIELTDTNITCGRLAGVMVYQSFSGDAQGRNGHFAMKGGSLRCQEGPLFYVTNTSALIELSSAVLAPRSGILLKAASGRWGRHNANGGHAVLRARHQTLSGEIQCDALSSVTLDLGEGSEFDGTLSGSAPNVILDATSRWSLSADTTVAALTLPAAPREGIVDAIEGNGHDLRYDASLPANKALGGATFQLARGGRLLPR